jgi:ABC-type branched-subunit amino acid transport system substrate-binding protein
MPSVTVPVSGGGGFPVTDSVIALTGPYETAEALQSWRLAGWDGSLFGTTDLAASSFWQIADSHAVGVQFVTPYPRPQDLADMTAWIEAYRDVGPHVSDPSTYALPTYEAVYALAESVELAIARGISPGREGVMAVLPQISRHGWLGTLTWSPQGYWADMPLYHYAWEPQGPRLLDREP